MVISKYRDGMSGWIDILKAVWSTLIQENRLLALKLAFGTRDDVKKFEDVEEKLDAT